MKLHLKNFKIHVSVNNYWLACGKYCGFLIQKKRLSKASCSLFSEELLKDKEGLFLRCKKCIASSPLEEIFR